MKVTVPVGAVAVAPELSVTVAIQSLGWRITTGLEHVIVVVVDRSGVRAPNVCAVSRIAADDYCLSGPGKSKGD